MKKELKLVEARNMRAMSQRALAKKAMIYQPQIAAWEKGEPMQRESLSSLAKALDCVVIIKGNGNTYFMPSENYLLILEQ